MWYRCRRCNFNETRGCLPSVSCGIYLLVLVCACAGVALPLIRHTVLPDSLPWWAWLLIVPGGLVVAVIGGILLDLLLQAVEWLLFAFRRCPRCRARRWSWGFTGGFGL